jgi:opine dehydrogenase
VLNVGWFDRAIESGEVVKFYGAGNTVHTGKLAAAQDMERRPLCHAYGVPYQPLAQYLRDYYSTHGETIHELVRNCEYYQSLAPYPTAVWQRWMSIDVPNAHVPLVALAELAGIAMPLHRAVISMVSALIGYDFWANGITLERLGLGGMKAADVKHFVETGTR